MPLTPELSKNGIAVVQSLGAAASTGAPFVVTRLVHSSGQFFQSECPVVGATDMQKLGSAITYARRYSLSAICSIAADEDDDGNAAVQQPATKAQPAKAPEGFDDWLIDLEAVADEGTDALQSAWKKSQPFYRKHLTDTNETKWTSIKNRAAKAKQPEPVGA